MSVRVRRASMSAAGGLSLLGSGAEASGGSGDEGLATAVATDGGADTAVFWGESILFNGSLGYTGAVANGQFGCYDLWLQRYD